MLAQKSGLLHVARNQGRRVLSSHHHPHRKHRATLRREPCSATAQPTSAPREFQFITLQEVQDLARDRGLCLTVRDLGPFYRIVCREDNEDGKILALTTGFVAPLFRLMHCDTLQVFTRGIKGEEGERVRGGPLGLGLLMGGATFSYGYSCGCTKAEILAINDDDAWHARLVRYYSYFGFEPVAEVGGGELSDLPHMLVWGGAGTRMDADIPKMLAKWTPAFRSKRMHASRPGAEHRD